MFAVVVALLLLSACSDFAVVKSGLDLCIAVAPSNATPAEVAAITAKCGEGK